MRNYLRTFRGDTSESDWLVGGGAMAGLIKAMDWSKTPLGSIDAWPPSLRTVVSLAQASNSPISLSWGSGHTQIYNDGYWPICGDKHPQAMGQDFRKCWATAWPVIGAAYASASSGKTAYLENMRMFLDRYGFLEETWFTFSFSPITDESGRIAGLFHPVTELTAQSLSERRTRTLADVAALAGRSTRAAELYSGLEALFAASNLDVPFFLLYLLDESGETLRRCAQSGLDGNTSLNPADIRVDSGAAVWPIGEIVRSGCAREVSDLPLAGMAVGPYPEAPNAAVVLPVVLPGHEHPIGAMVAGISSRLRMTEPYRIFLDLLAASVSTALTNVRAHDEERRRIEAMAEIDRAKTAFFSNVSHEFRTPLTLMLGPLEDELRERLLPLPRARHERLATVHRNSLRLLKLVNNLLDFSRIEAGRVRATYVPTNLAAFTRDLASVFRAAVERGGLVFTVDCPELPELVYVDREMWEKIVLNLLSNAFKHTFEGSIAVRLKWLAGEVQLSVEDSGVGIRAEDIPRLFERFHRVSGAASRTHEGTGIGLSLVRELVQLHGGRVLVESEFGRGSRFMVALKPGKAHLPELQIGDAGEFAAIGTAAAAYSEEATQWLAPAPAAADIEFLKSLPDTDTPAPPIERPRIIWADDNADMRRYVHNLLASQYDVLAVSDGEAALQAALAAPPDLVLSDIMMPRLNGVELLQALRADERTRRLPVILLSARAGEESALEGLEAGADDYLVKPFSAKELLTRVRTTISMAQIRREWEVRQAKDNRFLDSLIENLPVMVIVKSAHDLRIVRVNREMERFMGIPREELLGKTASDLVDASQAAFAIASDREAIAAGSPIDMPEQRVGNSVLHTTRIPIAGDDGRPQYLLTLSVDITRQKSSEQSIRTLNAALESRAAQLTEANLELESFSYSVSHDLRAPLRTIDGFAAMLEEELSLQCNVQSRRFLSAIRGSAKRMGTLIDDLLNLARLARATVTPAEIDVELLVRDVAAEILREHGSAVRLEIGPLPTARGDGSLLRQVWTNLISNAVKYSARSPQPRIDIIAERTQTENLYRIRDNGVGFDMQYADKLFDPFQRLHPPAEFSGTGVGLAIVQRIVARHGGRVWGQGRVHQGAEFGFALPR